MKSGPRILLGVSGSIAAVKAPELVRALADKGYAVNCVMTKAAEKFVTPLALATLSGSPVVIDAFDDDAYRMKHLELAEQAQLLLIAPATANVMARCAQGLTEDMISLIYLTTKAPVLMAPAMHPTMWEHPASQANVKTLKSRGVHFSGPIVGPLADHSRGEGRMSEPEEIVKAAEKILQK